MIPSSPKLSEVATVFNGKTPSSNEKRLNGKPILKIKDIDQSGQFVGKFNSFVDEELFNRFLNKTLKLGDILILNAAHNASHVASKFYQVEESVINALPTGEWLVIRPDPKKCSPGYIYFWLKSFETKLKIKNLVKGIHLYPKDVSNLKINLPSSGEQKRIADILDKTDALRQKRQQMIDLSSELLRTSFLELCGPNAEGYNKWDLHKVDDLVTQKNHIRSGPFGSALKHSEFKSQGVYVLGIDNAVKNTFVYSGNRYISREKYEELKKYTVFPGDVLISIMGTTGKSAVVPESIPLAITTKHLATITPNKELIEGEVLSFAIHTHPEILKQIQKNNKGAVMPGLNLGIIKNLTLSIPPMCNQKQFIKVLSIIARLKEKFDKNSYASLLNSLTQRAFRGEL
jgi:type I restriction enzyme S subunit